MNRTVRKTGRFQTETFSEVWETYDIFEEDLDEFFNEHGMTTQEVKDLYYHLLSKYADSNIRYSNPTLFKLNVIKKIECEYPHILALKRDQKALRDGSIDDFKVISKHIANVAAHTSSNISNDTLDGLDQLDQQSITHSQLGDFQVLLTRMASYISGFEDRFINSFTPFFIQIISPFATEYYITEEE